MESIILVNPSTLQANTKHAFNGHAASERRNNVCLRGPKKLGRLSNNVSVTVMTRVLLLEENATMEERSL